MATAEETLRAVLSETEYRVLRVLADSTDPPSGRRVATALGVSPTTANRALGKLADAGFATRKKSGRANLWQLAVSNPAVSDWLEEVLPLETAPSSGSSPYSTGGGGVRLEHSYAACLIAAFLAGESLSELGDALSVDSIRLQASDVSEVDDILVEGRDAHGETHRSSIAVRRNPALVTSDRPSVPLIRDFLVIVTEHWLEVSAGRWRLVLAVATNANAIAELAELAELAAALPSGRELAERLAQAGRTNAGVRDRYGHIKGLVEQAAEGLSSARGLGVEELTWRLLAHVSTRTLRLERTDRTDRTTAVNALQRILSHGTSAAADSLFSRIEELAGRWAPQGAVLTQTVIRRSLSDYPLSRSARFAVAWAEIDRLGARVRDSIRPGLRAADSQWLELERPAERSRLLDSARSVGESARALVVVGDPDVGKSALSLRVAEVLQAEGAAVARLSLRDLPDSVAEFESRLGGFAIDEVMSAGEVRPIRLLLVDGAESILEGRGQIFRTVAAAALRAGWGVVAVTRTDGSRQVRDELARSCELVGSGAPPVEHVVGPLTEDERDVLTTTFTALARLRGEPRTSWLLGRPGLVDALLRTGEAFEPDDLLCEADVFRVVWRLLIRGDEVRAFGTASPDDREQAALNVARRTLGLVAEPPRGTAAGELRSDGVLRVPNDPALSPGDEFATDLFRDFALCRLFIIDGWAPLASAGAPRWSIRAARLGCQAALASSRDRRAVWATLVTKFSEIADELGQRWLEVPYEALLTLGDAAEAIRELWGILNAEDSVGLRTLLRLAQSRYVNGTIGDPFSLAPVVKVTFCDGRPIGNAAPIGHKRVREVVQDIVLAWLRGMANTHQADRFRQQVRDVILDSHPPLYDDFAIEALASLGPDLDARAEKWLREVAAERPGQLHDAVESFAAAVSMSTSNPGLLLDLAEAYYIEQPDPRDRWGGGRLLDDGIRDFKHGLGPGFGVPFAAWYYGPFFRLLNTIPREAIAFINRMLNHAARFRVEKHLGYGEQAGEPGSDAGIELDLPGVGQRRYIGDGHVWAWYRGTSVGPYACMSALLALERFVDYLLENLNIPAQTIVELLLRDCHNLAVPGLIVGFLTRHPDARDDLLDPFLASPTIWHLETARVTGDYGFRARDADADKLTGADRRKHTFQETVGAMVVNARLTGDEDRLTQLKAVGERLIETARAEMTTPRDDDDYLAMIASWAAMFQIENYRASSDGDQVFIEFERPEQIEQALAPRTAELQITNTLYSLQNRYGQHNDSPEQWPVGSLQEDLTTARRIEEGEDVPERMLWPENGLVAVAGAAVRAHGTGLVTIDATDLAWAAEAILWAAENPQIDDMSDHGTMFAMGADRAAAASVPLLALAPFDRLDLDRSRVERCLRSLATSLFDEVRAIYVKGCEPAWVAECDIDRDTGHCLRHRPAWIAARAGLIDCRLGPWNNDTQRREPDPLPPPLHDSLSTVADDSLLVNRLRMPLACMVDARQVPCLQNDVRDLWAPLWDAHRRGLLVWWKEGYDHHSHITHEPIARRMIETALDGDREPVRSHIEAFATDSNALHLLFDGFATVFTYDEDLRRSMADFWPLAMEVALDAVGDGSELRSQRHWFDYMAAALLPTPNARSWDSDIDGTLALCRESWLQPDALHGLADRWLRLARWEPKAVDAVIQFAKGSPLQWQTTVALSWIEIIIDGRDDLIANQLWFVEDWLTDLRNRGVIVGDVKRRYHRIVDGLAAAGDRAAVRLQQLDE